MNALLSEARAKVGHRLAMHLRVDLFRLRNATPMVSFTFDDLPKSAVTTGAAMLEAQGARGTLSPAAWSAPRRRTGWREMRTT